MGPWTELLNRQCSELRDHWRDRSWWAERIRTRINTPVQQWVRPREQSRDYVGSEWDVLIVLDACRADLFYDLVDATLFEDVSTATSPASETREWLEYLFDGQHGDIVYVAGNPMVSQVKPSAFHDLVEVWRTAWDATSGMVRPEAVTEAAKQAAAEYPNKRIVVHYMQPHAPFPGYPDLNFSGDADEWGLEVSEEHPTYDEYGDINNPWEALAAGIVDEDHVWEAYEDALEHVVQEVESFIESTDRRVVVTSDHGNAFGERSWPIPLKIYGHPGEKRHSVLTDVPWAVADGSLSAIEDSTAESSSEATEDEVAERLAHLGYVEE